MTKKWFIVGQVTALAGLIFTLAFIVYGIVEADIITEGNLMLSIFWGKFTFIDIYMAFVVFYIWVLLREKNWWMRVLWFMLIMAGGSMSICLYLFIALSTSNYNVKTLFTRQVKGVEYVD